MFFFLQNLLQIGVDFVPLSFFLLSQQNIIIKIFLNIAYIVMVYKILFFTTDYYVLQLPNSLILKIQGSVLLASTHSGFWFKLLE